MKYSKKIKNYKKRTLRKKKGGSQYVTSTHKVAPMKIPTTPLAPRTMNNSREKSSGYIKKLKQLYPACEHDKNKDDISKKYAQYKTTYGEMDYEGIESLYPVVLQKLEANENITTFMDIGSGRGKLVMYMANKPNIQKSVGVELVDSRHKDALHLRDQLAAEYPDITKKVEFLNEDVLKVDLRSHIMDERNHAFVWFSNLCFEQSTTNAIFEKLKRELPQGSIICCSKQPNIQDLKFLETVPIKMSWMDGSQVHIYKTPTHLSVRRE
jgi:tRNA G46 methylase TrmB